MFYHIKGVVSEIEENLAVVDCNGVGYALNTTANTLSQIEIGKVAKLYVFDYVKEDCFELYGFISRTEKRCFELLLSVSGVGPKAAISILSVVTPESLTMAVVNGDEKALTAAQGIGRKIAQRIILELKDKIAKSIAPNDMTFSASVQNIKNNNGEVNDAIAALNVLGYGVNEISAALRNIDVAGMSAQSIIKAVLKSIDK